MDSQTKKGILLIIAGVCMHFYLGCLYLWGNISVYVTSYFHKLNGDINLDTTSIVFVVQISAQSICTPLAPIVLRYIPPWASWLIGGVIGIGSVFLSSYAHSFPLFVFLYGFWFGVGIGFSYMCPIIAGWEYFPKRKGLVSGLIVAGYGFGSFIFGFISLAIANPDNVKPTLHVEGGKIFEPDDPISSRAPKMIRYLCIMWAGLLIIALPFLRRKGTPQIEEPSSPIPIKQNVNYSRLAESDESKVTALSNNVVVSKEPTFKESLFSWKALHLFLMIWFGTAFWFYIAANFKSYGSLSIPDDKFMTIVGSVGSTFNGVSRLFWAYLFDIYGFKKVYFALLVIEIPVAFTLTLVHKSRALYLVWVCLAFTWLGGHFSLFPSVSAKVFGPRAGGATYSVIFMAFAIAAIFGWLLSKQSSHGNIAYDTLFYILGAMACISLTLLVFFNEKSIVKKEQISKEIFDDNQLPTKFMVTDE